MSQRMCWLGDEVADVLSLRLLAWRERLQLLLLLLSPGLFNGTLPPGNARYFFHRFALLSTTSITSSSRRLIGFSCGVAFHSR